MDDQFVTYKIALKLKELGFDEISRFGMETSLFNKHGKHTFYANYGFMGSGLSDGYICAPLWQECIDWLRKKYRYDTQITFPYTDTNKVEGINSVYYDIEIYHLHQGDAWKVYKFHQISDDYHCARERAILDVIKICQKK